MPKINVYLPDDLADAVKDTGVPVSAICQRALEQAVRRVTAIRQTALGELAADELSDRLPLFTARARRAVKLAIDQATRDGFRHVGTGHLLAGMIAEGDNLALRVLVAIDVDPAQVQRDLTRAATSEAATDSSGAGEATAQRFSGPAANALELAVTEASALGHNYVGCEHLLLALVSEPDGTAGTVLRALGAEVRLTRRAVTAALAGYVHLRAQSSAAATDPAQALAAAVQQHLQPLLNRIERLEQHLGPQPGNP